MKGFIMLLGFMTRIPVPQIEFDSRALGKSMKYFPVVGLFIGLLLYLTARAVSFITGSGFPFLLSVFVLLLEVVLAGALHLDGLADTFDGMFSYRSKQKILEIMKDSRIGTNGVLALIFYFLLKWSLFAELFFVLGKNYFGVFLVTMPVVARLGSVLHCACFPYARGTGMGKTFVDHTTAKDFLVSLGIALAIFIGLGSFLKNPAVIFAFALSILLLLLAQYLFGKVVVHRIGGITGDTLGAVVVLSEVVYGLFVYVCLRLVLHGIAM